MDDVYAGLTELLRPAERGQALGGWLFGQVQQAGQGRCGWCATACFSGFHHRF